ncbi:unnamed protein product, partial [marine sediment metagenome]
MAWFGLSCAVNFVYSEAFSESKHSRDLHGIYANRLQTETSQANV